MKYKCFRNILLLVTLFSINVNLLSQQNSEDSIQILKKDFMDLQVSMSYGIGDISRLGLKGPLSNIDIIDVSFGFVLKESDEILEYNYLGGFATLGFTKGGPNSNETFNKVRFGETTSLSYVSSGMTYGGGSGYSFGSNSSFMLTTHSSFGYTTILPKSYATKDTSNWQKIADFDGDERWTRSWSPGVKIALDSNIGIRFGYTWTQVYSRILTLYEVGSTITQISSEIALHLLKHKLIDRNNDFYPVVDFLLTNSLQYLLYNLKSEKMSWPFNTAPPLNIKYWNISVNYAF